jgi:hypothetical protein
LSFGCGQGAMALGKMGLHGRLCFAGLSRHQGDLVTCQNQTSGDAVSEFSFSD